MHNVHVNFFPIKKVLQPSRKTLVMLQINTQAALTFVSHFVVQKQQIKPSRYQWKNIAKSNIGASVELTQLLFQFVKYL
jgi:hypothetical protein